MFHSLGYRDIAQGVQAITQGPDLSHSTKHGYLCFTVTLPAPMLRPLLGSENPSQGGRKMERRETLCECGLHPRSAHSNIITNSRSTDPYVWSPLKAWCPVQLHWLDIHEVDLGRHVWEEVNLLHIKPSMCVCQGGRMGGRSYFLNIKSCEEAFLGWLSLNMSPTFGRNRGLAQTHAWEFKSRL